MSILYTISEVIILKTIFFRHFFNIIFLSYFLGRCSNGTESVGCGPQEEFRACSDVSITTADGYADATINELGKEKLKVTKKMLILPLWQTFIHFALSLNFSRS